MALDSPKKRTDEFDLFAVKSKKANKTNLSVHFLGESMARQSAFEINWPLALIQHIFIVCVIHILSTYDVYLALIIKTQLNYCPPFDPQYFHEFIDLFWQYKTRHFTSCYLVLRKMVLCTSWLRRIAVFSAIRE